MGILSTYRDFKSFEPNYDKWYENQVLKDRKAQNILPKKPVTDEVLKEQARAKILTNVLTSLDEYAQTKAEDVDSTSQTLLYIAVGALGAIGTLIGDKLASLTKNSKASKLLSNATGVGLALLAFMPIAQMTVKNQVRANRMARFEGIGDKLFHINNFAVLTPEQKKQADEFASRIPDNTITSPNSVIDRANIFNSMSVYRELTMKQGEYHYLKNKYDERIKDDSAKVKQVKFSEDEIKQANKDRKLFNKILQKIDIESHYPLERVEKGVNIAYSALFAGGVLEYILSDGILDFFKVKHKLVRPVLSWGIPILTIMSINKQLANFLNDAVKAVRYKKMQEFVNNPDNFKDVSDKELENVNVAKTDAKKPSFTEFFKQTLKDIKDYEKYQDTKRISEKKFDIGVRNIELSKEQEKEAKLLKRNAEMVVNTLDDQTQKYDYAVEALTESSTIPVDIVSPILGTYVAGKIHKAFFPAKRGLKSLFRGLGIALAFIPAAMTEWYFVAQQRSAKRCATHIANSSLQDSNKFLDPGGKEIFFKDAIQKWTFNARKSVEEKNNL